MKKHLLFLLIIFILSGTSQAQSFNYTSEKPCAKYTFTFIPAGITGATEVVWDWGDGNTSTVSSSPYSATHVYIGSGSYQVTMTPNVGSSYNEDILIYDKPNLNIEYTSEGVVCAPDSSITIKITSSFLEHPDMNTSINWGEDATESDVTYNEIINQTEIAHFYTGTSCGNETEIGGTTVNDRFMIIVSASNICTDINEMFFRAVEIKSKPNAGIEFTDTTVHYDETSFTFNKCETGEVTIKNTSYGEDNCLDVEGVLWEIIQNGEVYDECSGCEEEFTPIFNDYGQFQIKLTQSNICGSATYSRNLNIRALPIANFQIMERKYCYPAELTFVNQSESTVIVSAWDFIGDSSNVVIDSSYTDIHIESYTEEGEYNPKLQVWDGYCHNYKDTLLIFEDVCEDLYVPNAFIPTSPNDDLNSFKPKAQKLLEYKLEIYNLQGERLWVSKELTDGYPAEGWDGTYNGNMCQQGTYIWKIYAVIDQGQFGERNWEGQTYKERENKKDKKSTSGTFLLIR